jgi:hypothetical protein
MTHIRDEVLKVQLEEACRRLGVEYERNHKLTGEVDRLTRAVAEDTKRWKSDVPFLLKMLERARCGCYALDCRKHGAYVAGDIARVEALQGECDG